jgi:hypothetical protein
MAQPQARTIDRNERLVMVCCVAITMNPLKIGGF